PTTPSLRPPPPPQSEVASTTLGRKFNRQLAQLMRTLKQTSPHFIRCIKPNSTKSPHNFDSPLVLTQMRYGGLFEPLRIRRLRFPFRKARAEFFFRYRPITALVKRGLGSSAASATCEQIVDPEGAAHACREFLAVLTQAVEYARHPPVRPELIA